MVRSQIYLTEKEKSSLKLISEETGRPQSDLIREAIDLYIDKVGKKKSHTRRAAAFGLWKDNDNVIDIESIRKEFDRTFNES